MLRLIKSRLVEAKGAWPEELPNVLWAYRTTTRTPTGETPFNLTYGTEAVILVEVGLTSLRKEFFDEQDNNDQLKQNLDLVDEVRDQAVQRMAKYKQKTAYAIFLRDWSSDVCSSDLLVGAKGAWPEELPNVLWAYRTTT